MKFPLFKDSTGKPSFSFSMAASTFVLLSLWLLLWLILVPFGIAIPPFDVAIASGWFTPIAALYFGRRMQKGKAEKQEEQGGKE